MQPVSLLSSLTAWVVCAIRLCALIYAPRSDHTKMGESRGTHEYKAVTRRRRRTIEEVFIFEMLQWMYENAAQIKNGCHFTKCPFG